MEFFEKPEAHSIVKSTIVEKYFDAWSRIMCRQSDKIGYIDLFAGPGIYEDGTKSTPIKIITKCVGNENLRSSIVTYFNDANKDNANSLKDNIFSIENINTLKYKPVIENKTISEDTAKEFEKIKLIPSFSFIDPFGYKGLSKRLIISLIKDWGCDCIFFFNYSRINAAVNNSKVKELVDCIFGTDCIDELRINVDSKSSEERESYIIDKFCEQFVKAGFKYTLPFRFQFENKNRTSHYLIFVTKKFRGYDIMKDIMSRESSINYDGIGSFSYIPNAHRQLSFLPATEITLEDLQCKLIEEMPKGTKLNVKILYEKNSVGTPYVKKNYKAALLALEEKDAITVISNSSKSRRKGTMSDNNTVIFK